jgi:hypothetical protein
LEPDRIGNFSGHRAKRGDGPRCGYVQYVIS